MLISMSIFDLLAVICFLEALTFDIDAYDFASIYSALNPAKIFFITSLIILVWYKMLYKKAKENFDVERIFSFFVALLFATFGSAYFVRTNGNEVLTEKAVGGDSEFAYELTKIYLPYYVFNKEEPQYYEVFKGDAKSTSMVYVDSEINNDNGNMQYEAEFLKTKNPLIYYKFLLSRVAFDDTSIAVNGKEQTVVLNETEVKVYTEGKNYASCIKEHKNVFYVTLSNVKDITTEDFARVVVEQYNLMKETIKQDKLLEVNTSNQSNTGDGTMIDKK